MRQKAVLLTGDRLCGIESRAARLLEFFGVRHDTQSAIDFTLPKNPGPERQYRIIGTAQSFESVANRLQTCDGLYDQLHSIFLFSNGDPVGLSKVVSQLAGNDISVRRGAKADLEWTIADDPNALHGVMRGLSVHPTPAAVSDADLFEASEKFAASLIASEEKAAFIRLRWRGVPVFVSSVPLVNIDADLTTQNFDVRDHLFDAVPFVCYLKWAFGDSAWHAPEAGACVVVDDPLLKPRYGFVRYRELLALMKQVRFATTIAFIPWNWRRSDPDVVQLFKENVKNYSVCVHGCDHTAQEFASSDRQWLRSRASAACERMSGHQTLTGLEHDRVMVFPQGAFSAEAIGELKSAGFDAIVNTEVHSNGGGPRRLTIADVWDVAVMSYDDFAVYTRRYPSQGVENFAFDLLLGKPGIIVIHHDFCKDRCSRLVQFIHQLNSLRTPLTWRCLGDVVKRSYRQKKLTPDSIEIEIYSNQAVIENTSNNTQRYVVRRRERQPDTIDCVRAGSEEAAWHPNGGYIQFEVTLQPGETILLAVRFKAAGPAEHLKPDIMSSARTTLRRYLSEARDNYLTPARARIATSCYV
ncbi:MAG TPA: hypothetical protein VFX07_00215 [Candidatus Udaeobacter sp.]|nr:hypothetical protein [Candidatus Udaeobacter sp.]